MFVFVINKHGQALMPCKPRKARVLLREKKTKIVAYKPFTIQLLYGSSGYKQQVSVGVDLGVKHVGIAITSDEKLLVSVIWMHSSKSNSSARKSFPCMKQLQGRAANIKI